MDQEVHPLLRRSTIHSIKCSSRVSAWWRDAQLWYARHGGVGRRDAWIHEPKGSMQTYQQDRHRLRRPKPYCCRCWCVATQPSPAPPRACLTVVVAGANPLTHVAACQILCCLLSRVIARRPRTGGCVLPCVCSVQQQAAPWTKLHCSGVAQRFSSLCAESKCRKASQGSPRPGELRCHFFQRHERHALLLRRKL